MISPINPEIALSNVGVEMIPTRKWGDGNGGLIGCSIRFCMFDAVNDVVWHILVMLLFTAAT
jgi:hypothetical protein